MEVFVVCDGDDDGVVSIGYFVHQGKFVFVCYFIWRGIGVHDVYVHGVILEFVYECCDLRVSNIGYIFFKGDTEDEDFGESGVFIALDEELEQSFGDPGGHTVVDTSSAEDDLWFVSEFHGFVEEVVGVHTDAVAADESGVEFEKIPFGTGGFDDFVGIDAHPVEDDGQFVHQGDIEVSLGIFDDFGGLCHFDAGGFIYAGLDDFAVCFGDIVEGDGVAAGDDFEDFGQGAGFVAWVYTFWGVTDFEVIAEFEVGVFFEQRQAVFFGTTGVHGGFEHDVIAFFEGFSDADGGFFEWGEVWDFVFIDVGGDCDDEEVCLFEVFEVAGKGDIGVLEVIAGKFAAGVFLVSHHIDACFIDIETDDAEVFGEGEGERQADVPEADDGDFFFFIYEGFKHSVGLFLVDAAPEEERFWFEEGPVDGMRFGIGVEDVSYFSFYYFFCFFDEF